MLEKRRESVKAFISASVASLESPWACSVSSLSSFMSSSVDLRMMSMGTAKPTAKAALHIASDQSTPSGSATIEGTMAAAAVWKAKVPQ